LMRPSTAIMWWSLWWWGPVTWQRCVARCGGWCLPGRRRAHMTKESAPRRRLIADTIVGSGVTAAVFDAGDAYPSELDARRACLRGVISYADYAGATRLVLERDDSPLAWDTRRLWEITGGVGCRDTLRYSHARASEELLLAIPMHRLVLGQGRGLAPAVGMAVPARWGLPEQSWTSSMSQSA